MKKVPYVHWPIFISGSVVILLAGIIGLLVVMFPEKVNALIANSMKPFQSVSLVSTGSSVEVYREYDHLKLKFEIQEEDQEIFDRISERLGVSNDWQEGVSIGLDAQTLELLSGHLPAKGNISFEGNLITISGGRLGFLRSGASGNGQFEYATGSASLRYSTDKNGVQLVVINPSELVSEATKSGEINVSKKIESELFSLADKIDTIDLELKSKSLEGEIRLK